MRAPNHNLPVSNLRESITHPEILDPSNPKDRARLHALRCLSPSQVTVHDTIHGQLRELVLLSNPSAALREELVDVRVAEVLRGVPSDDFGRWVYFPWSSRLVHLLPPSDFHLLRHDRNRFKITGEEQESLARLSIGIVGLSVGNAIARTLAREGLGGRFRVADHDCLDISNLNRVDAGVHENGTNKAALTARQIYEGNPYAKVEVFEDGLTETNLGRFLLGPPRLDVLVDECDSLEMKVRMRELAREWGIPVLMETSDRGILDVERFDLEPHRPLLHGRIAGLKATELTHLTKEQKVAHVLQIIRPDEISPRLAASMIEIGRTIVTWPQLASEVQLGSATVATAVRRLALGLPLSSGRRYIDLSDLTAAPAEEEHLQPPSEQTDRLPTPVPRSALSGIPQSVLWLADHANLAPSGGNRQPWCFTMGSPDGLTILHDKGRSLGVRDFGGRAACIAIGAAVENAIIAAAAMCRTVMPTIRPPQGRRPLAVELWQAPEDAQYAHQTAALLPLVRARVTNRGNGTHCQFDTNLLRELESAAEDGPTHVQFVSIPASRAEIGRILGTFDRIQFTTPAILQELAGEIRWSREEAELTRDGIDVATIGLESTALAALRLVLRPEVASILRTPGRARALEEPAQAAFAASAAVGLIRIKDGSHEGYIEAGRTMQRIWLRATRLGLGVQPWTALTFVAPVVDQLGSAVFNELEGAEIRSLSARLDSVFTDRRGWTRAVLFRVSKPGPPAARSLRRHLAEAFR
jgi:tRNA A37 threonylcarbamoyladenosine dehydratase